MGRLYGFIDCSGRAAVIPHRINASKNQARYAESGLLIVCERDPAGPPECQPCLSRSPRGNIIAWDGRLHNRADVCARLGEQDLVTSTDASAALAMYEGAGVNGLGALVGDWSAILWDAATRSLLLASDFAGIRPLYYMESNGVLRWSSSLREMVEWASDGEPDDSYIAEMLVRGVCIGRTPYRGIRSVPPGKALLFRDGVLRVMPFWKLNPGSELRLRSEEEYVERLQMLFEEAVRVRLIPGFPAYVELSGGLDSSSIACMAHKLTEQERPPRSQLTAVTYTHPDSSDGKFASLVQRWCGIPSVSLDVREYPYIDRSGASGAAPCWWTPRNAELSRRMTAAQTPVLLSGQLGDLLMGNWYDESDRVAGLLSGGDCLGAISQARAWSTALNVPVASILCRAIRLNLPFIPPPNCRVSDLPRDRSDSLSRKTRKRAAEIISESDGEDRWRRAPLGHREHFRAISEILNSRALEVPEALYPIHYSHPYAHRPLVEFMLAVPPEIVCGIGEPRRLMRRAFGELLPRAVLHRKSKASFARPFSDALRPLAAEMLAIPQRNLLVARGHVEPRSLEHRLRRFLTGLDCNESQLRRVIVLEFWLRSRLVRAEAVTASPNATSPELGILQYSTFGSR